MGSEPVAGVDPSASIVDVLIIGGGLAGVCAATAAVRQGFSVTLVSAQDRHPPDFRGEKLGEHELRLFEKVGVGVAAYRQMEAFDGVWTHRFGHLVDKLDTREYSSDYSDLVNALRDAMPLQIDQVVARVAALTTSEVVQMVTLGDGRTLRGRLLVVATGLGDSVRRMVGVEREIVRPMHSLCCGFDLVEPPSAYPFISLVWSDERIDRTVSYLSLFPMGGKVCTAHSHSSSGASERGPSMGRPLPALSISSRSASTSSRVWSSSATPSAWSARRPAPESVRC
jgi:2-polyprenyl-6-methoxyphenol hydroxylase-like FAD-dependent oxidoreductase